MTYNMCCIMGNNNALEPFYKVSFEVGRTVDGIIILTNLVALLSVLFWSARTFNGS